MAEYHLLLPGLAVIGDPLPSPQEVLLSIVAQLGISQAGVADQDLTGVIDEGEGSKPGDVILHVRAVQVIASESGGAAVPLPAWCETPGIINGELLMIAPQAYDPIPPHLPLKLTQRSHHIEGPWSPVDVIADKNQRVAAAHVVQLPEKAEQRVVAAVDIADDDETF